MFKLVSHKFVLFYLIPLQFLSSDPYVQPLEYPVTITISIDKKYNNYIVGFDNYL